MKPQKHTSSDIAQVNTTSGAREPGQPDEKLATGTKHRWTRPENMELLECYYSNNPSKRGYKQRMWDIWMLQNPTSKLAKKQLLAQFSNTHKWQLLPQLEIDEVQQTCFGKEETEQHHYSHTPRLGTKPSKGKWPEIEINEWTGIKRRMNHHGRISPCTACATNRFNEWPTSRNPTNGWKRLDRKTPPIMAA